MVQRWEFDLDWKIFVIWFFLELLSIIYLHFLCWIPSFKIHNYLSKVILFSFLIIIMDQVMCCYLETLCLDKKTKTKKQIIFEKKKQLECPCTYTYTYCMSTKKPRTHTPQTHHAHNWEHLEMKSIRSQITMLAVNQNRRWQIYVITAMACSASWKASASLYRLCGQQEVLGPKSIQWH